MHKAGRFEGNLWNEKMLMNVESANLGEREYPPLIGWFGIFALSSSVANLVLFFCLAGGLFTFIGSAALLLLPVSLLLAWLVSPAWLRFAMAYPTKVGGVVVGITRGLSPYSKVLATIIGVAYWVAWCSLSAFCSVYLAGAVRDALFPFLPLCPTAALLIIAAAGLALLGIPMLARVAIVAFIPLFVLLCISVVLPLISGTIQWSQALNFHLRTPFPGIFGIISSVMAGFYLISWIIPAYEYALFFVGCSKDRARDTKKAFLYSALFMGFGGCIVPFVWYAALGITESSTGITVFDVSKLFEPFGQEIAVWLALLFYILSNAIAIIAPFANIPRMLAQMANDGLIPREFSKCTRRQEPWVAIVATAAVSISFLLSGSVFASWFIACTNFNYAIYLIALSLFAARLLNQKSASRKNAYAEPLPQAFVNFSYGFAFLLLTFTILGFQQFGLLAIILGILFAFLGSLFYLCRRGGDRLQRGEPFFVPSLECKLISTMFLLTVVSAVGYLKAIHYIAKEGSNPALVVFLTDNFVLVALMTISVGLLVPGITVNLLTKISDAATTLVRGPLRDFSDALISLGQGDLHRTNVEIDIEPIRISSHDEMGKMAASFNQLQGEIARSVEGLNNAREKLIAAHQELISTNRSLEERVEERTQKLSDANVQLRTILQELELTRDQLIESEKLSSLGELVVGVAHEVGTPLGIGITALSELGNELSNLKQAFSNGTLTRTQLVEFLNLFGETILLASNNLERASKLLIGFKQTSADQVSEEKRTFDLNEYLKEVIKNVNLLVKRRKITVDVHCPEGLSIESYPGVIFQLISIFISNSLAHAFQPGDVGRIVIDVAIDNGDIILKYGDNGSGMPPDVVKRVFDPFFTTKRGSGGIGLGLNIAYNRVVQTLGGSIICESSPGKGTTFTVVFPAIISQNGA
jgi:signal transduction histidine kinase